MANIMCDAPVFPPPPCETDLRFPLQLAELEQDEWANLKFRDAATAVEATSSGSKMENEPCRENRSAIVKTLFDCNARRSDGFSEGRSEAKTKHLACLPEELVYKVGTFLDLCSLSALNQVNHSMRAITNGPAFWSWRFDALDHSKAHVSPSLRRLAHLSQQPKRAMQLALADAGRQNLTREELLYSTWSFCFKESAGTDWTSWDPYWSSEGKKCRKFVFWPDGTVRQLTPDDEGTNESCDVPVFHKESNIEVAPERWRDITAVPEFLRPQQHVESVVGTKRSIQETCPPKPTQAAKRLRLVAGSVDGGRNVSLEELYRAGQQRRIGSTLRRRRTSAISLEPSPHENKKTQPVFSDEPKIPPIAMTWRFIEGPTGFPARLMGESDSERNRAAHCGIEGGGGYLRLTVGGRDVPTYVIRRLSGDNWGFVMESCWSVFANFDVTKKPTTESWSTKNCENGANGASLVPHKSSGVWYEQDFNRWDSVTTDHQWKEAMLYNNGASVLPEVGATRRNRCYLEAHVDQQ